MLISDLLCGTKSGLGHAPEHKIGVHCACMYNIKPLSGEYQLSVRKHSKRKYAHETSFDSSGSCQPQ